MVAEHHTDDEVEKTNREMLKIAAIEVAKENPIIAVFVPIAILLYAIQLI